MLLLDKLLLLDKKTVFYNWNMYVEVEELLYSHTYGTCVSIGIRSLSTDLLATLLPT